MTVSSGDVLVSEGRSTAPASRDTPVWALPAVMVGLFWVYFIVSGQIEMPMFVRFLTRMGAILLVLLALTVWWLTRRRVSRVERWSVAGALVVAAVASVLVADKSMGPMPIFDGMPWVLTACTAWLLLTAGVTADRSPGNLRHLGLIVLPFATLGLFTLLRLDGLRGDGRPDYQWRWGQTSEDRYLAAGHGAGGMAIAASAETQTSATTTRSAPLTLRPGDWPAFRGPGRDANVPGVRIATDWDANPPTALWRRRVGPAWSSIVIVGDRVFTHEQHGDTEAVVCRDAGSGDEVWVHGDPGRFWESLSGAGPRATPAFADGRLFALGARGMLNCLDAATGRRRWSRDITADCGAKVPDWGFSGSPLVVDGIVVVYGGGKGDNDLLAYHAESGEPAWTAPAGEWSYSSPHFVTVNGARQVLFLSDRGVTAVNPVSGALLWEHPIAGSSPRSVQPLLVSSNTLLVSHGMDMATGLIELPAADAGKATEKWASRNLKPSFNDFVVHGGFVYGFDGTIFSCIDLKDGARRWKKGRYGAGQVLLLPDQPVLLVVSEQGEAVLVSTNPDNFEELGRFQAVNGKTWNHAAIAHRRLYVRSDAEMACFDLRPAP